MHAVELRAALAALVFFTTACILPAAADDLQRSAVVRIGGCSAVCVDPSGLLLTAKHCRHPRQVTFDWNGKTVQATKVYEPPGPEGVVVFLCDVKGFPYLNVAASPPEVGEPVVSLGYPAGHWARMEAQVVQTAGTAFGGISDMLKTNHRTLAGNSGGPLLNSRGEVVGICAAASIDGHPQQSLWIPLSRIQDALNHVRSNTNRGPAAKTDPPHDSQGDAEAATRPAKPALYVFTARLCPPCLAFKADYNLDAQFRARLQEAFDVVLVDPADQPELARRYGVEQVPAFRPSNAKQNIVGYRGKNWLMDRLGPYRLDSQPAPYRRGPESSPGAAPDPAPEPPDLDEDPLPAEIDWSLVTVVYLRAEDDVGRLRGAARARLIELATGPAERALYALSGGRAEFDAVFERSDPRFEHVAATAGVAVAPRYVLVLVREIETDWLLGTILKLIETQVAARLDQAPVGLIAQRAHGPHYDRVHRALTGQSGAHPSTPVPADPARQQSPPARNDPPWWYGLPGLLFGLRIWVKRKVESDE